MHCIRLAVAFALAGSVVAVPQAIASDPTDGSTAGISAAVGCVTVEASGKPTSATITITELLSVTVTETETEIQTNLLTQTEILTQTETNVLTDVETAFDTVTDIATEVSTLVSTLVLTDTITNILTHTLTDILTHTVTSVSIKATPTTVCPTKPTDPSMPNCPVPHNFQCGGLGWDGCTECSSGAFCNQWNPFYFQCIQGF